MVGDSAGIRICVAIAQPSTSTSVQSSDGIGLRARLREIGRVLHDRLHLVVDRLERGLVDAQRFQLVPRALDAVVLACASSAPPRGCGTSPGRTSSGRDSGRSSPPAGTAPCRRGSAPPRARPPPSPPARPCRPPARRECPRARRSSTGRCEAEARSTLVPMPYLLFSMTKTHRQLQQRGEVEALEDLALVGRALAEIGQARRGRCRDTSC